MFPSERNAFALQSVVKLIGKINGYRTAFGDSFQAFDQNENYQDLCFYALVQIGEAVDSLSDDFVERNSQIDWQGIYGMRCYLAHDYNNISNKVIWKAIEDDLPPLEQFCKQYLNSAE
ncbi:MAG: DUF86 domain-containing protein [Coriobacteriia bacterium]|nr:DUF86 domain-containing protein [Coriobacteriia bacterium]